MEVPSVEKEQEDFMKEKKKGINRIYSIQKRTTIVVALIISSMISVFFVA
jgi:hypothetical protein